jgi:hypothetical protein
MMAPEIRFTPFGIPYIVEFANVVFLSNKSRSRRLSRSASLPALLHATPAVLSRSSTHKSAASKLSGVTRFLRSRKTRKRLNPITATHPCNVTYAAPQEYSPPPVPEKPPRLSNTRPSAPRKGSADSYASTTSLPSLSYESHTTTSTTASNWLPRPLPPPVITPSMTPETSLYADGLYIHSDEQGDSPRSPRTVAQLRRTIAEAVKAAGIETPAVSRRDPPQSDGPRPAHLSRGEYGDFKAALKAVGLTYEKCMVTKVLPDGRSCVAMLDKKGGGKGAEEASLKICPATRLGVMFVSRTGDDGRVELRKLTMWA